MTAPINSTLDSIEDRLPLIPRRALRLQRAMVGAGCSVVRTVVSTMFDSAEKVESTARTSAKTVRGQARSSAEDVVDQVRTSAKTVSGQAKAEASQARDAAETEASKLLGQATRAVEGENEAPLEEWTKADLYDRAQELDLDGRSTMSKKQLIAALRSV